MNKKGKVACLIAGISLIIASLFCFLANSISDITAGIMLAVGAILGVIGISEKT